MKRLRGKERRFSPGRSAVRMRSLQEANLFTQQVADEKFESSKRRRQQEEEFKVKSDLVKILDPVVIQRMRSHLEHPEENVFSSAKRKASTSLTVKRVGLLLPRVPSCMYGSSPEPFPGLGGKEKRRKDTKLKKSRSDENTSMRVPSGLQCQTVPTSFDSVEHYRTIWFPNIFAATQGEIVEHLCHDKPFYYHATLLSVINVQARHSSQGNQEPILTRLTFSPSKANVFRCRIVLHDIITLQLPGAEVIGIVKTLEISHRNIVAVIHAYSFIAQEKIRPQLPMPCTFARLVNLTSVVGSMDACFFLNTRTPYTKHILCPEAYRGLKPIYLDQVEALSPLLWRQIKKYYNEAQRQVLRSVVSAVEFISREEEGQKKDGHSRQESCIVSPQLEEEAQSLPRERTKCLYFIHGPPGTGKTHTIIGLLSLLISVGETCSLQSSQRIACPILVCAGSNAAVDEILLRVIENGLLNQEGISYIPRVVRLGVREHVNSRILDKGYLLEDMMRRMETEVNIKACVSNFGLTQEDTLKQQIIDSCQIVFSTVGSLRSRHTSFETVILDEASQITEPHTVYVLSFSHNRVILVGDPMQLPPTVLSLEALRHGFGISLMERMLRSGYPSFFLPEQYRMHPTLSHFPNHMFYQNQLQNGTCEKERKTLLSQYTGRRVRFYNIEGIELKKKTSFVNAEEAVAIVNFLETFAAYISKPLQTSPTRNLNPAQPRRLTVGIITPYAAQQVQVHTSLSAKGIHASLGSQLMPNRNSTPTNPPEQGKEGRGVSISDTIHQVFEPIEVNTVDGFQGREKDVILISCVRSSPCYLNHRRFRRERRGCPGEVHGSPAWIFHEKDLLTFLDDKKRANVALTRAREMVCVFGNEATLRSRCAIWSSFIEYVSTILTYGSEKGMSIVSPCAKNMSLSPRLWPKASLRSNGSSRP